MHPAIYVSSSKQSGKSHSGEMNSNDHTFEIIASVTRETIVAVLATSIDSEGRIATRYICVVGLFP